jgi:retron-type reverse transcriptase
VSSTVIVASLNRRLRITSHRAEPSHIRVSGPAGWYKGALTRGATANTLDGFSIERMTAIAERVGTGTYRFTPVRRVHIPKANGKTRPLGVPTADDKLVQGVVKLLLALIYEPVFSRHSHGFRQGRSCHTALSSIQDTWNGMKWLVDVDVVGFF